MKASSRSLPPWLIAAGLAAILLAAMPVLNAQTSFLHAFATNVGGFSATLEGGGDAVGLTTTVYFEYGPTTSYGFTTPEQTETGHDFRVSAHISGLMPFHIYRFRMVAHNNGGTILPSVHFSRLAQPGLRSSRLTGQHPSRVVFQPRSIPFSIRMG